MIRKNEPRRGAKIRFVMLEAEVEDGNFNEITQAINSALRPATAQRTLLASPAGGRPPLQLSQPANPSGAAADEVHDSPDIGEDAASTEPEVPRETPKARVKREWPKPKVVHVDFGSGPDSLEQFIQRAGSPTGVRDRYLTIAAWFHEHRQMEGITTDHVYTCFKKMDWAAAVPNNLADPLWKLHKRDFGTYAKNVFSINQIGLNEIAKMSQQETVSV